MNTQHIFDSLIVGSRLFNTTFTCLTKYQENAVSSLTNFVGLKQDGIIDKINAAFKTDKA